MNTNEINNNAIEPIIDRANLNEYPSGPEVCPECLGLGDVTGCDACDGDGFVVYLSPYERVPAYEVD